MPYRIQRYKQTVTIAAEGTTKADPTTRVLNGYLVGIQADVPALVGTTTLTLALTDEDGYTLYSKASIAEGAKFTEFADSNNVLRKIPLTGIVTITVTASNAQTGAAAPIPVVLLIDRG